MSAENLRKTPFWTHLEAMMRVPIPLIIVVTRIGPQTAYNRAIPDGEWYGQGFCRYRQDPDGSVQSGHFEDWDGEEYWWDTHDYQIKISRKLILNLAPLIKEQGYEIKMAEDFKLYVQKTEDQ